MEYPEGLPGLSSSEQARVDTDNAACQFVLDEIQQLAERGGISVRENPWRSLHWHLPTRADNDGLRGFGLTRGTQMPPTQCPRDSRLASPRLSPFPCCLGVGSEG